MSVERNFDRLLSELDTGSDGLLAPSRVAQASKLMLGVTGASVSIAANRLRVPLGASDEISALAERLQFTLGGGPCMTAIDDGIVMTMPQALLANRYPALAEAWATQTPFRSVISHPLRAPGEVGASLNLFFDQPSAAADLDPAVVASVALAASAALFPAPAGSTVPFSPGARRRMQVWVAVGVVMSAKHLTAMDGLAWLRARAYAAGGVLDDVAARLVEAPELIAEWD